MSSIQKILFLPFLFLFINSQLTIQDKENIEKFILNGQSKTTGFFFENTNFLRHTKEAISSLQILNLDIKHKKEICKKITEIKEVDYNIVGIDKLLDCKKDFKGYKPDFTITKLVDLYHESIIMDILNIDEWNKLFKVLKHFLIQENGKFSLLKIKENKKKSIMGTALGVEMLVLIGKKSPSLKSEIMPILQKSVDSLMKVYSELSEDMIVFIEKGIGNY